MPVISSYPFMCTCGKAVMITVTLESEQLAEPVVVSPSASHNTARDAIALCKELSIFRNNGGLSHVELFYKLLNRAGEIAQQHP